MRAARTVGSVAMEDGLELIPFIDTAASLVIDQAQAAWIRRRLPDALVLLTDFVYLRMPEKVKEEINTSILTADVSWFDTHPPLFKRVAALKKAKLQGVLKLQAPATVLFRDFDELCKLAMLDLYQAVLGPNLRPEHLHPTRLPEKMLVIQSEAHA